MSVAEFTKHTKTLHSNTINTVANRMILKGILKKERGIRHHRYFAIVTPSILQSQIDEAINSLSTIKKLP